MKGNEITFVRGGWFAISSDTWNISPDDIESVSVLKGPTAAALYGSRAQYGAILITTKRHSKPEGVPSNSIQRTQLIRVLAFPGFRMNMAPGENALYAFGDSKGGGLNDNDYDVWGRVLKMADSWFDGEFDPNNTFTTTFPGLTYTGHIKPRTMGGPRKKTTWAASCVRVFSLPTICPDCNRENYNLRFSCVLNLTSRVLFRIRI